AVVNGGVKVEIFSGVDVSATGAAADVVGRGIAVAHGNVGEAVDDVWRAHVDADFRRGDGQVFHLDVAVDGSDDRAFVGASRAGGDAETLAGGTPAAGAR